MGSEWAQRAVWERWVFARLQSCHGCRLLAVPPRSIRSSLCGRRARSTRPAIKERWLTSSSTHTTRGRAVTALPKRWARAFVLIDDGPIRRPAAPSSPTLPCTNAKSANSPILRDTTKNEKLWMGGGHGVLRESIEHFLRTTKNLRRLRRLRHSGSGQRRCKFKAVRLAMDQRWARGRSLGLLERHVRDSLAGRAPYGHGAMVQPGAQRVSWSKWVRARKPGFALERRVAKF